MVKVKSYYNRKAAKRDNNICLVDSCAFIHQECSPLPYKPFFPSIKNL